MGRRRVDLPRGVSLEEQPGRGFSEGLRGNDPQARTRRDVLEISLAEMIDEDGNDIPARLELTRDVVLIVFPMLGPTPHRAKAETYAIKKHPVPGIG